MTQFNHILALGGAPIETLRGVPAKILTVKHDLDKPLIVQVGEQVYNYTAEGKRSRNAKSTPLDLQMSKEAKAVEDIRYINISYYEEKDLDDQYKLGVYIHKTRKEAYEAARAAANVRIVAMPVPFDFKTDQIQLYTKRGDALVFPENSARNMMDKILL